MAHVDPDWLRQYSLQAYQAQAARTAMNRPNRIYTDVVGLGAEYGELLDEYQHAEEQQRDINMDAVRGELGDMLWRISDLCSAYGWQLAEVARENIEKLQRRHPDGFSAETSKARMDKMFDNEELDAICARCGKPMEHVRPGKWQCNTCEKS